MRVVTPLLIASVLCCAAVTARLSTTVDKAPAQVGVTVAAVQLVPASGITPIAAGMNAGMQVASIVANLTAPGGAMPDLVVFPEYNMLGNYSTSMCADALWSYAGSFYEGCVAVPDPGEDIDCSASDDYPLRSIACNPAAEQYKHVTISINLCERCEGSTLPGGRCAVAAKASPAPIWKNVTMGFFNTQVVIRGTRIVQTYRKLHPWATECYDTPELQVRNFTVWNKAASASKTFGLFTCFDIVFPQPSGSLLASGVHSFSYSSAIPLVGREAVKLFSLLHNATMVNANLQSGQTAISHAGVVLAECAAAEMPCAAVATLL
jgi:predicted amidohydrolase